MGAWPRPAAIYAAAHRFPSLLSVDFSCDARSRYSRSGPFTITTEAHVYGWQAGVSIDDIRPYLVP